MYGALYSKLAEFSTTSSEKEGSVKGEANYTRNATISRRATKNMDKNILFVFTEGNKSPSFEENYIQGEVYYSEKQNAMYTRFGDFLPYSFIFCFVICMIFSFIAYFRKIK